MITSPEINTLPLQKVSRSKKTKQWKEDSLDAVASRSKTGSDLYEQMSINYELVNGEFNQEDFKYVTDPFNVREGFPAKMQNVNIIAPKIRLLVGEATKRPQNYIVYKTGEAGVKGILDYKKQLLLETLTDNMLMNNTSDQASQQLKEELAEIENYITNKYYDPAEQTARHTLDYLNEKLNLLDQGVRGFEDGLISNREAHFVGIVNGEPYSEKANVRYLSYDESDSYRGIEDGDWVTYEMEMTASEIHDRFYDELDDSTFKDILEYIYSGHQSAGSLSNKNAGGITFRDISKFASKNVSEPNQQESTGTVIHCVWRSYKKIGYLLQTDPETGEENVVLVDESYKSLPDDQIEWDWIDEIWEGYKLGEDIRWGIQPLNYYDDSVDNLGRKKLPYVGGSYNGNNVVGKSLVGIMKPLAYFYRVLFYRLELTLARDKGKILNMDITQIPTSMGLDTNKWLHYLTSIGVNFINPYEEGWDIPGRTGGKAAAFNQITDIDLTMGNVIREYIELLNKIEEMIGELSGISRQRQGAIQTHELVGNVERSVIQSSHITEPLFWRHSQIWKNVLTLLIEVAKHAWRNSNKTKLSFILDGPERVFLNINEDFLYSDYDIFISDSTKEFLNLQKLEGLYQPAMQGGASLLDIAEIMTSNNISDIKSKLQNVEQQRMKMQQQMEEARRAVEEQKVVAQQEANRIKEEDSIRKAQTDIEVALIQAQSNNQSEEGYQDVSLDQFKIDLQKEKQNKDYDIKNRQLAETVRHNKAAESISKSKPKTGK